MKNTLLFFIIVILSLSSCNDNENKYSKFFIESINNEIIFPSTYSIISTMDYLTLNTDTSINNILKESHEESLIDLITLGIPFTLLYDTIKTNNNIVIYEGEYLKLNTVIGSSYLKMLEGALYKKWNSKNIAFSKKESKYHSKNGLEFLKIKYNKISNYQEVFMTQYIISSKKRTFTIIINNNNGDDFENAIKMTTL